VKKNSPFTLTLSFFVFSFAGAQSIVNPLWDDADWKNWYLDPEPLVNSISGAVLAIPEPEHRIYPADVPETEANPNIFLHHTEEDYPGRPYAGIHGDLYVSYDGFHSDIRPTWSDNQGNFVNLKPNNDYALQRLDSGELVGQSPGGYHEAKRHVGLILARTQFTAGALRAGPGSGEFRNLREGSFTPITPGQLRAQGLAIRWELIRRRIMCATPR